MARITIEDCVDKVPNRFDLVLLASHRARVLGKGAATVLQRTNDKNPVIALREIAERAIRVDDMREGLLHTLQQNVEVDEPDGAGAPIRLGHDNQALDRDIDQPTMTEDELLRGMRQSIPTDNDNEHRR